MQLYARGVGRIATYDFLSPSLPDESDVSPQVRRIRKLRARAYSNPEYPDMHRISHVIWYYFPTDPSIEFIDQEWIESSPEGRLLLGAFHRPGADLAAGQEPVVPETPPLETRSADTASEAVAGVGTVRVALSVYWAMHRKYPMLKDASGGELSVIKVVPDDLDGKYLSHDSYKVTSTETTYTITATFGEQTYITNQDNEELGTYRTAE